MPYACDDCDNVQVLGDEQNSLYVCSRGEDAPRLHPCRFWEEKIGELQRFMDNAKGPAEPITKHDILRAIDGIFGIGTPGGEAFRRFMFDE